MLNFGIWSVDQLKNEKNPKNLLNSTKKISVTLYDDIQNLANAEEVSEQILLLASDERGAYKRTYQNRFEDFDGNALKFVKEKFTRSKKIIIYDVAVSDGRTALDFFEKMVQEFPDLDYKASDYNSKIYVIGDGRIKLTLSHNQKVIEILLPPFIINEMKKRRDRFLKKILSWLICPSLIKQYKQGLLKAKELLLFSPRVLRKSQEDKRFSLHQHNLLFPFSGTAHIIRAMNILNLSYFSPEEFMTVLGHIYHGLKMGGLLITGSNQNAGSLVHGAIYKKTKEGFEIALESGDGSPIKHLISGFHS